MNLTKETLIPNLIVPGAGKSGTTSLHRYLNLHPEIEMSRIKEPKFFTRNDLYSKGLRYYNRLFNDKRVTYWGESSTAYFGDEKALKRIKKELRDVKFIVLLRDPVERTISHYLWEVNLLNEFRSLRSVVKHNINNPTDHREIKIGGHLKSYYEGSLYGRNITRLIRMFGKENIHVIKSKDLKSKPNKTLNTCFKFLDLQEIDISVTIETNKTEGILNKNRARILYKFFAKALRQGVIDLRLLFHVFRYRVGKVTPKDYTWLHNLYKEDTNLLLEHYPNIANNWKSYSTQ